MNSTLPQPALPLPPPPPGSSFHSSPNHGIKRSAPDPAEDELERSSQISTQFKKLRLNNQQHKNPHRYDPDYVFPTPTHPTSHCTSTNRDDHRESSPPTNDSMTVDDTPHRIYITDLDSEIASIEAAEDSTSQLFPQDLGKQIGAIPEHVLRSNRAAAYAGERAESSHANSQALILYREPASLVVPTGEDVVRKAILDARRGIREKLRREQQRERETAHELIGGGRRRSSLPEYIPDPSRHHVDEAETMMEDEIDIPDDGDEMEIE